MYDAALHSAISAFAELNSIDCPTLSPEASAKLSSYIELLMKWTKRVDLIADRDVDSVVNKHIVDSLFLAETLASLGQPSRSSTLIDIGSGAGLPGIVLAVYSPSLPVTLCEPREKRTLFLKEACRQLKLDNVVVERARMDALKVEPASVGVITARAVGLDSEIMSLASKVLAPEGMLALPVGSSWIEPELPATLRAIAARYYKLAGDSAGRRIQLYQRKGS